MNSPDFFPFARWIESDLAGSPRAGAPAPIFQKSFHLEQPVPSVWLTWTCLGLAEVQLDGESVHDAVLLPGWTDLRKRLRVMTVELGPLSAGTHVLRATLGDGWAVGHVATHPRQLYSDRVRFRAELHWQDGGISTDATWETYTSEIVRNDLLMGETVDARLREGTRSIRPAVVSDFEEPPLVAHCDPVVKRQERFTGEPIGRVGSEEVFDLGQNLSGRVRIRVKGDRGATVTLRHAEMRKTDGSLYLENLRSATATDHYTLAGGKEETWEPSFTFHGFRYVSVEIMGGEVELLELIGIALYSDMEQTGEFSCSHAKLNQLFHNIVWGQNGNFLEVPTDCPQRDERLGWTGDAQVFAPTAAFLRDCSGFFRKWLRDLRDAQGENGAIPCYAPDVGVFNLPQDGGPAWGDAIILIPWYLYEATGDPCFLEANYDAGVRYVEYLEREKTVGGIRPHPDKDDWGGFGDWLALDGSGQTVGNTPKDLIGTAFLARDLELLRAMAERMDLKKDAARWEQRYSEIRNAFRQRFLTPEGLPVGATQTACIVALQFNLVTDAQREGCVRELVRRIHSNGCHIGTGFVGTPYILNVLAENGHLDLAYTLLEQEDFPSWLFPVTLGATTIWERWDGWHPERGFQDVGMNSFNHYAYGAVGEWMIRTVAGLRPEEPGYRVIRFKPRPGGSLTQASASLKTRHGLCAITWQFSDDGLKLNLTVPEDCSAILDLPEAREEILEAGEHQLIRQVFNKPRP